MKDFIKNAKLGRKKLREAEDMEKKTVMHAKEKTVKFLSGEVQRMISSLESIFDTVVIEDTDDEIIRRKAELPDHLKEMQILAKTIKEMMIDYRGTVQNEVLDSRYADLIKLKSTYVILLNG